jgi:hypothetical protein
MRRSRECFREALKNADAARYIERVIGPGASNRAGPANFGKLIADETAKWAKVAGFAASGQNKRWSREWVNRVTLSGACGTFVHSLRWKGPNAVIPSR